MRRPGRAGTQAGSGRVAATTTVAPARAADRPGLPDDTQVTRRLPRTSWHEPYGYAKTPDGIAAYRKRSHIAAETPHGNMRYRHAGRATGIRNVQ